MMSCAAMRAALPDAVWSGEWPQQVVGFAIDTRKVQPGDVFIALPGARTDGHDFLAAARQAGAVGAIVAHDVDDEIAQLRVANPEVALQALAAAWRAQWQGRMLALTGSNGKTTTKEMLASILGGEAPTCVTEGNLNNHLGVPLTLLRLSSEHAYAVIEMGANHAGEIAQLSGWAKPDVGLVTLAGPAHLEGFGSIEGVAAAKGEIYSALAADGVAVINAADQFVEDWQQLASPRPVITFNAANADVRAEDVVIGLDDARFTLVTDAGRWPVTLSVTGRHNVQNALAAAAGALALGLAEARIVAGLEAFSSVSGRLRRVALPEGRCLIDDSYNANPSSVNAAIDVLAMQPAPRLFCLGDMAELGADAVNLHASVGRRAREAGLDALWTCGPLAAHAATAFGPQARQFSNSQVLGQELAAGFQKFHSILVKGSRSARMEVVVERVLAEVTHA